MKKTMGNCWNFWKCPSRTKKQCPACRHHLGDMCWFIVGMRPRGKRDFKKCWACPWFKRILAL